MGDASSFRLLSGLSEIAFRYDAAICDVWGVVHNGREASFGAVDAMRRFRERHGPVVLLSNAPRPGEGVRAMFDRLKIPHDFYDSIVTSGGAARDDLARRTEGRGSLKLFYLGPPRDHPLFEGLNVTLASADDAELVLCTGFYDDEKEAPEDYRALLEHFLARKLLFLCANPDIVVQRGDQLIYCAGAIAQLYEAMGGDVVYYGKPYPPVFNAALAEARKRGEAKNALVIGDGLETDIKGANRLGLDALFIVGGIHAAEFREDPRALAKLLSASGARTIGVMPALSW
jgi:HAD superfamily hydrolase (TIGR01459 family)